MQHCKRSKILVKIFPVITKAIVLTKCKYRYAVNGAQPSQYQITRTHKMTLLLLVNDTTLLYCDWLIRIVFLTLLDIHFPAV